MCETVLGKRDSTLHNAESSPTTTNAKRAKKTTSDAAVCIHLVDFITHRSHPLQHSLSQHVRLQSPLRIKFLRARMHYTRTGEVSLELLADKSFAIDALVHTYALARIVARWWSHDAQVMLAAIRRHSELFKLASHDLLSQEWFVLRAVEQNMNVLEYVSRKRLGNRICSVLLATYPEQCRRRCVRFICKVEVVMEAIRMNPLVFKYVEEDMQDNPQVFELAIERDGSMFNECYKRLSDYPLWKEVWKQNYEYNYKGHYLSNN